MFSSATKAIGTYLTGAGTINFFEVGKVAFTGWASSGLVVFAHGYNIADEH